MSVFFVLGRCALALLPSTPGLYHAGSSYCIAGACHCLLACPFFLPACPTACWLTPLYCWLSALHYWLAPLSFPACPLHAGSPHRVVGSSALHPLPIPLLLARPTTLLTRRTAWLAGLTTSLANLTALLASLCAFSTRLTASLPLPTALLLPFSDTHIDISIPPHAPCRESCMLDMLPHFKHLNSKLRVSQVSRSCRRLSSVRAPSRSSTCLSMKLVRSVRPCFGCLPVLA